MVDAHHVVIIGGGFGGLYAAKSLKRAPVRITLLDRRNFHLFQPLLLLVATGTLSAANIAAPLRAVLKRQCNIEVQLAEAVDMPNFGLVFNSQFRENAQTGWRLPPDGSIRPLYDRFRPHLTQIHTHQMERPDQLPMYQELFRLLKADGWNGYVAMEAAYTGPDPEKVLRLYTALFHTLAA